MAQQHKQDIVSGIVEPVQDRSVLSTRQLLEAAGALIAERGYENTSIAAIGERAGYSRGLVTARFGTKQNLLNALLDRITFDWIDVHVTPELSGLSGLDGMLHYLDTVAGQLETDPGPLAVLWSLAFEALRTTSELRERFVPFHEGVLSTVTGFIEQGIEDGSIRDDVDPVVEGKQFTASLRGIAYQWLLMRDDVEVVEMFREFRRRAERDLRAPKRRRSRTA